MYMKPAVYYQLHELMTDLKSYHFTAQAVRKTRQKKINLRT